MGRKDAAMVKNDNAMSLLEIMAPPEQVQELNVSGKTEGSNNPENDDKK